MLAFVLMLLMLCAWLTDTIGIYSIFGGFILGIAMPRGFFATRLLNIMEPLVTNFLLPLSIAGFSGVSQGSFCS
jgi:Kef-type K+ transport system membrane component KefB